MELNENALPRARLEIFGQDRDELLVACEGAFEALGALDVLGG